MSSSVEAPDSENDTGQQKTDDDEVDGP